MHVLSQAAKTRPGHCSLGDLFHHQTSKSSGVSILELSAVVGEQTLGHQLQQHVVITLEGDINVHICAQCSQSVLCQEALTAACFTCFLQCVKCMPRGQGLQRGCQCFQVLTVVIGVISSAED